VRAEEGRIANEAGILPLSSFFVAALHVITLRRIRFNSFPRRFFVDYHPLHSFFSILTRLMNGFLLVVLRPRHSTSIEVDYIISNGVRGTGGYWDLQTGQNFFHFPCEHFNEGVQIRQLLFLFP
jgi:hypothetical protein